MHGLFEPRDHAGLPARVNGDETYAPHTDMKWSVWDVRLLHQAANYLNIKELLDLTCLTVANMIKGEGLRRAFLTSTSSVLFSIRFSI